jgi:molybdenum cofactor cytidylyltransferase
MVRVLGRRQRPLTINTAQDQLIDPTNARPTGLLLAGGRGSRFAATGGGDKLLAVWDDLPIAAHAARLLQEVCPHVFAILPRHKPALAALLAAEGCELIENDAVREGMGVSIATAVRAILARSRPAALIVMLADMPAVHSDTIRTLLGAWRAHPDSVCVLPTYRGRRGHPVLFGAAAFEPLAALSGDRGAGQILDELAPHMVEVDDPGILRDIDTTTDLQQLNGLQHGPQNTQD